MLLRHTVLPWIVAGAIINFDGNFARKYFVNFWEYKYFGESNCSSRSVRGYYSRKYANSIIWVDICWLAYLSVNLSIALLGPNKDADYTGSSLFGGFTVYTSLSFSDNSNICQKFRITLLTKVQSSWLLVGTLLSGKRLLGTMDDLTKYKLSDN